jgi:hypothetical protein
MSSKQRLRYQDLEARRIVQNRVTLGNWIRNEGFPPGQLTGPNSRTWGEDEVDAWLASRPVAPKALPPTARPRGRPRKESTVASGPLVTLTDQGIDKHLAGRARKAAPASPTT